MRGFSKGVNESLVIELLQLGFKLAGNIHQVNWFNQGTSVELSLSINA